MLRHLPFGPVAKSKCYTRHALIRFQERSRERDGGWKRLRESIADAVKAVWLGLARCEPSANGHWRFTWNGLTYDATMHPVNADAPGFVVTTCFHRYR